jgi:Tol biopolymer transport system component/tetratricopeptide (TPR) repeat protein
MSEEFTVQCQSCGTLYNDLQEVCPYCGEPQPSFDELPDPQEELPGEPLLEEDLYEDQEEFLPDDAHPYHSVNMLPDEEYLSATDELPEDEYLAAEDHFADDDIFAIAGENGFDEYDELGEYDEYDDDAEFEDEAAPHHFTGRRILLGCLGIFLCLGLLYGGIGLLAVRRGLEERALSTQAESETHYQRGQEHLANDSIELAIAEFELALSINPNFTAARQALREAQKIAQAQPSPTSQTRSAAAADRLAEAETQINGRNWSEAIQILSQVRDLDPDYLTERVSELLYTANYELGLQQLANSDQLENALIAFEHALAERPNDPQATQEQAKVSLYLKGIAAEENDREKAIEVFSQLHQEDANYLDVEQRLWNTYQAFGDALAEAKEWCMAEVQYIEANTLQSSRALQIKVENSGVRCQDISLAQRSNTTPQATSAATSKPTVIPRTADVNPPPITATLSASSTASTASGAGSIFFSSFNPYEAHWEIISIPANGGTPKGMATNATMPAVSPNGQLLLYHSELLDAEGFHILDLTAGEERRITFLKEHILPRWSGDNQQFIFVAQEPTTGRWQVLQGFADGKSDPIILRDGRTPDWSSDRGTIAFQGTDAEGNNPGIYLAPFGGGEVTRLTNHESDRSPDFSPDGSQLAYMSTRNGNWDIYTISTAGSTPRQISTAPGNDGLPAWSPDGSRIAYVSDADGSWAIYVINASGGTPTKLTEWDGSNRPNWLTAQIWWAR